jgi:hypothetical protein
MVDQGGEVGLRADLAVLADLAALGSAAIPVQI